MSQLDMAADMRWILATLRNQLLVADQENILRFFDYGEWALAVETLCEQLCERQAAPNKVVYQKIMDIASQLEIDDRYRRAVPQPTEDG